MLCIQTHFPVDRSWVKPENLINAMDNLLVIIDGKLVTQRLLIVFEYQYIVYPDEAMQTKHISGELMRDVKR